MDRTVDIFRRELDRRFVTSGEAWDLGTWLQYFAVRNTHQAWPFLEQDC